MRLAWVLFLCGCETLVHFDPPPERSVQCHDGIDNDDDGDVDCADSDCSGECSTAGCGNGRVDPALFRFGAGTSIPVPGGPIAIAAALVNADTQLDIVAATAGSVRELRNEGGALTAQQALDTSTIGPTVALAIGRLDQGTSDDVALLIAGQARQVLPIFNDAGTFRTGRAVTIGDNVFTIAAGAFDGRPGDDLFVGASESTPFLVNNGMGVFTAMFPTLPATGRGLAVGDADNDGDLDVVVAATLASKAYLLTNVGTAGTGFPFQAGPTVDIGAEAGAISFIDADGTGGRDAVVLETKDQRAHVLLRSGSGGALAPGATLGVGGSPVSLAVADFDLDGHDDVAVGLGGGSIVFFLGDGHGAFHQASTTLNAASADALVAVELDGKRGVDLAVAERAQNRVTVFLNTSTFEACDDGNTMSGDSCNADCTLP